MSHLFCRIDWSAVGAIATSAAVIVALYQARLYNKKCLKVKADDSWMTVDELGAKTGPYLRLGLVNTGNRRIIITQWGLKVQKNSYFIFRSMPYTEIPFTLPTTLYPEEAVDLFMNMRTVEGALATSIANKKMTMNRKAKIYACDSTGKMYYATMPKPAGVYVNSQKG